MFKFALFLAVAVVAVQGLEPRSEQITRMEAYGVIDVIKEVIEKIRDLVSHIDNNLGEIIKNLADKIKNAIENIEEAIKEIKQKIEEFIHKYGISVKCYRELKPEIEELVHATRSVFFACVRKANEKLATIKGDVADLVKKAVDFQTDVNSRVLKCVQEAEWNVSELRDCLKAQVDPIKEEFVQLQKEVDATIEASKVVVAEAKDELDKCLKEGQEELSGKQQQLSEHLLKCMDDNQ